MIFAKRTDKYLELYSKNFVRGVGESVPLPIRMRDFFKKMLRMKMMTILKEFSHEYLTRAISVLDSSDAPRTEERLMVLEETFSLDSQEASWLYNAIVFARPLMHKLKSMQIVDSAECSDPLSDGSRRYGKYTFVVVFEGNGSK
jgi:hypothetical protein